MRISEADDDFFLQDGVTETGSIAVGEAKRFFFTSDLLRNDLTLEFALEARSGPMPQLFVKSCG